MFKAILITHTSGEIRHYVE